MEDIVQVLDEHTANQIAAGEVVERPASVVKELVENAIDAASSHIEVEICAGGCECIRVSDDGWGMSAKDAQTALLRHATSKIRSADDLYHIASLGFRGEALPSIAAVSRFTLTTRRQADALATQVNLEGGRVLEVADAGAGVGTTITVRDLFFNLPARLKFLKKPASEGAQIHDVLSKLALSHPEISFRLIHNQRLVLATEGTGRLEDVVASLYGKQAGEGLMPLDFAAERVQIQGVLGQPTLLKSSRHWQTFLVNGRVVQSRALSKALDNAYHSVLPKTGFPLAVVRIDVPAEDVDVNVHPQKSEVKFQSDQELFRAVYKAVTACLVSPPQEPLRQAAPGPLPPQAQSLALPFQPTPAPPAAAISAPPQPAAWREAAVAYEPPSREEEAAPVPAVLPAAGTKTLPAALPAAGASPVLSGKRLQVLGQVCFCYIIAKDGEALYLVDQHAAHERILYDRLSRQAAHMPGQPLLVPVYLELDEREERHLEEHGGLLLSLGFRLELAGPGTARLLELPADIAGAAAEAMLRELFGQLDELQQPTAQQLRHVVLETAACHAAIRAGEELDQRQMERLLEALARTELPYSCPHGRPIMIRFGEQELRRWFKRT